MPHCEGVYVALYRRTLNAVVASFGSESNSFRIPFPFPLSLPLPLSLLLSLALAFAFPFTYPILPHCRRGGTTALRSAPLCPCICTSSDWDGVSVNSSPKHRCAGCPLAGAVAHIVVTWFEGWHRLVRFLPTNQSQL